MIADSVNRWQYRCTDCSLESTVHVCYQIAWNHKKDIDSNATENMASNANKKHWDTLQSLEWKTECIKLIKVSLILML